MSELESALRETLEEMVEAKLKAAAHDSAMQVVGDNTYLHILKRLALLEELCLEHRADWAEQRLRALEAKVKNLEHPGE